MSPDPDDPAHRVILTVDDAIRLVMEHAMGLHTYRMSYGGERYAATFTDVFATQKGQRPRPMDVAMSIIRQTILNKNISIGVSKWGRAYIVLFTPEGKPLPPEEFTGNDLQKFCLRIMELCAAWRGVDQHLDT